MSSAAKATMKENQSTALDDYLANGFHIEPGLFTKEECEEIKEAAKSLEAYKEGTYVQTLQAHTYTPAFFKAMKSPKLVSIMEKLLGGKVDAIQSQFFFGKPGVEGFTVHQDNYFVQAPNDAFGSAWLALDDVDRENGTLIVYPGSHKEGILEVAETGEDKPHRRVETLVESGKYETMDVVAKAGSVVFIHGCVVHSSHDNISKDRFRHVLLMTFVRQGAPFRSGYHAKREIFNVYE